MDRRSAEQANAPRHQLVAEHRSLPRMDAALIEALATADLIDSDTAEHLNALGNVAAERLTELAEALAAQVQRMLGPADDADDADALPWPEPTDDDLVTASLAAEGIEGLRTELTRRHDARATVLARLRPDRADAGGQQPPAQPQRPQPGQAPTATPVVPTVPQPRPQVGRVAARGQQHRGGGGQLVRTSLTASGRPIGRDQLGGELAEALRHTLTSPTSLTGRRVVATEQATYPEHRTLGRDATVNRARIDGAAGPDALVASGGICGPSAPVYAIEALAADARPVRDTALVGFGADRGGVVTFPAMELADVSGGVGVWTNADDVAATGTKACMVLDCPTEQETLVQAITTCVTFGNLQQRFFPERLDAAMRTLAGAHARLAEQTLLTAMAAGSVAVTTAKALGAARDVLEVLDRAIAGMRARQRLAEVQRLRLVVPSWLRNMLRADIAREIPGRQPGDLGPDPLATADLVIDRWLSVRGVAATWSLDMDVAWAATQAAGALLAWPASTKALLYPEGSWLFLDGGSLDLGILRDSTLTSTNDAMAFSETFEGCVLTGPESLALTMTIAPTGEVSGTADLTP